MPGKSITSNVRLPGWQLSLPKQSMRQVPHVLLWSCMRATLHCVPMADNTSGHHLLVLSAVGTNGAKGNLKPSRLATWLPCHSPCAVGVCVSHSVGASPLASPSLPAQHCPEDVCCSVHTLSQSKHGGTVHRAGTGMCSRCDGWHVYTYSTDGPLPQGA